MRRIKILLIFAFVIGSSVFASVMQGATVFAACSQKGDTACVQQNCNDAKKYDSTLTDEQCLAAVKACENTGNVGSTYWTTGTERGNCSNALRSCFENISPNETKKSACTDKGVLAVASSCNTGNVDAGGRDKQCGLDHAIDAANVANDGDDYKTNGGLKTDRLNQQKNGACKDKGFTIEQIETCEKNIDNAVSSCYDQNGGTARAVSNETFNNCMASKANSSNECDAVKGKWDGNTKKCTIPAASNTKTCNDGSQPDKDGKCADGSTVTKKDGTGTGAQKQTAGEAGTCGKARTNLIVCDGEGMQALAGVLRIAIFVLTVIVGIAATGGIAYSAVLYAGAQDNAGNTQKAKELIRNIVIGLIAYGFMIAIITWLVPGMNIKS